MYATTLADWANNTMDQIDQVYKSNILNLSIKYMKIIDEIDLFKIYSYLEEMLDAI